MFYKVTSVLQCPEGIDFWSTGKDVDRDYIDFTVFFFLYPGYLVNTTDVFGNRTVKYQTYMGRKNAITWSRVWYSKEYFDLYNSRIEIKDWLNQEDRYRKKQGISYFEEAEFIEPKMTSNGVLYLGQDYVFLDK